MESLTHYINHPEQLDAEAIQQLWNTTEAYPYYQPARLLLMHALYKAQDSRFGPALRQAALAVPDRAQLFALTEGEKYKHADAPRVAVAVPTPQEPAPSGDLTQDLINAFLSQHKEEPRPHRARPVEASVDYMSYLMQTEEMEQMQKENEAQKQQQVKPAQATALTALQQEAEKEPAAQEGEATSPYLTETLAKIYIKQGKYTKAIEIIRRLSLLNPKKNRYFADQIRFLEKLALNQRNLEAEQEQEKETK